MVEKELIKRKLSFLEEYHNDLKEASIAISYKKFSEDKIIRRFIERTLQMAIECCLDIAQHIISYEKYREPISNQDIFQILIEENILDKENRPLLLNCLIKLHKEIFVF